MKIYLAVIVLLFSLTVKSQINPADSTVQVVAYWNKNETQTFELRHTKSKIKGNDTLITSNISYKADVTVLDSTATSYTIQWKYRDYIVENMENNVTMAAFIKIYNGLTVEYKTDELGSFTELLNWEEIKKHNDEAFELLKKELNPTLSQTILTTLMEKFSTKEAVNAYSLKDIQLFHGFFGLAVKQGEMIEQKVQQEQPFNNKPVNTLITLSLEEIDFEEGTYIIKYWEDFESEGVKVLLKDLFTEILGDQKDKYKDDTIKSIALTDYCGVNMHESGWPIQIHYERLVSIENTEALETRSITIQ